MRRLARAMASRGASSASACARRRVRGVVFDMDGTLTLPTIDFGALYRECGLERGKADVLAHLASLPEGGAERARVVAVIERYEREGREQMALMPGALELGAWLDRAGVPRGLVTRNVYASVEHFHARCWSGLAPFAPALAREFEPPKPSPAALLHIAQSWGVPPSELLMVGDSAKDDVVAGNRAGAATVLLDAEGRYGELGEALEGERVPTHVVRSLAELPALIDEGFELLAPAAAAEPLTTP